MPYIFLRHFERPFLGSLSLDAPHGEQSQNRIDCFPFVVSEIALTSPFLSGGSSLFLAQSGTFHENVRS